MSRTTRRVMVVMAAAAFAALGVGDAFAAGGFFPNYPGDLGFTLNTSTQTTAVIVVDPNGPVTTGPAATSTGTMGAIAITRAGGTAAAAFRVEADSSLGELRLGCNLSVTNARFVEFAPGFPGLPLGGPTGPFFNWLASSITLKLFNQLGVSLVDQTGAIVRIPGIASVVSQQCLPFPRDKKDVDLTLFNDMIQGFQAQSAVAPLSLKPNAPSYPDRTIPGALPADQWFPGVLVLQVTIGLWEAPAP